MDSGLDNRLREIEDRLGALADVLHIIVAGLEKLHNQPKGDESLWSRVMVPSSRPMVTIEPTIEPTRWRPRVQYTSNTTE